MSTSATLTITASDRSKTYGTSLFLGTGPFTTSGNEASSETVTAVTLTSRLNRAGDATTSAGAYFANIVPSAATGTGGFLAANYDITYVAGKLTVSEATADCSSIAGYTGVYDGNAHGATGDCFGVDGTTVLAGLDLGPSFTDVPGSTADWAFTDVTGNYTDQDGSVAIVISEATADCSSIAGSPASMTATPTARPATASASTAPPCSPASTSA